MSKSSATVTGKIISSVKILSYQPTPLIRFTLQDSQGQKFNCLVKKHGLNFLYDCQTNDFITIDGYFNSRQQLIMTYYFCHTKKAKKLSSMTTAYN